MQHLKIQDWSSIVAITAILCGGALFVYRKVARPLWRYLVVRKQRLLDAIESVEVIRKQIFPNGGTSMRDEVKETVRAVGHISLILGELSRRVAMTVAQNRQLFEQVEIGLLEGDEEGEIVWANRALRKLTGLRMEQIIGSGWINAVHDDDRRRVENDWLLSTQNRRPFIATFRLAHVGTGVVVPVQCEATPVVIEGKENNNGAGWIALLRTREATA